MQNEREKFNLKVKHQELTSHLELIGVKEENLKPLFCLIVRTLYQAIH